MTSKELLEIYYDYIATPLVDEIIEITKPYFERLEQLEIANKNNEGLVRENTDLINRNLELQDENKALKGNVKILEENKETLLKLFDKAMEENTKLKKVIEILKRFHFQLNQTRHNSTGFEIWIDSLLETEELSKEEFELLKEVLE